MHFAEIPFGTPAYDESVRLRDEILRRPLSLVFTPAQLSEEYTQIHLGCYDDQGELIACLVLKLDEREEWVIIMRQVAVAEHWQGKGIGSLLVKESEDLAKDRGFRQMTMNARETAVPFYERLGYERYGKRFTEVTIPHFRMRKAL